MNEKINEMIEIAKLHCEQNNIKNFVIIENIDKNYVSNYLIKNGYDIEYDVIFFNEFEQIKNFISKKIAYDFIDNTCKLNENEKIIYIYSKTNIVIM